MCKVLIVDDEAYICKLIENLVDWNRLGMWIAGIANDGMTAYQAILDEKPDIVISDIRMSGLDGIELIRHAREAGLDTNFIFISGYRQFEYVQNAMKYGAADYLLKPINKEELTRVLLHIKERLAEQTQHLRQKEEIQQMRKKNSQLTGSQMLEYLSREETADPQVLQTTYDLTMSSQRARFAVLKVFTERGVSGQRQIDFVIRKISQKLEMSCAVENGRLILSEKGDELMLLLLFSQEQMKKASDFFAGLWKDNKRFIQEYGNYSLSVGCGPIADHPEQLQEALRAAFQASNLRFLRSADSQIELQQVLPKTLFFQDTLPGGRREISAALAAFDFEKVGRLLEDSFDEVQKEDRAVPENLFDGLDVVSYWIREEYGNVGAAELERVRICPRRKGTFPQMKAELLRLVKEIMAASYEEKRYQEEQPIRIAKRYVEENFSGMVSLERAADLAGLNPNYFSVLFKKITGKNFSEYLTDWRMEEAKHLLRTTTKNLAEISMAVGYKDAKYFSKLFTRTVGLKPNEYRKLYS